MDFLEGFKNRNMLLLTLLVILISLPNKSSMKFIFPTVIPKSLIQKEIIKREILRRLDLKFNPNTKCPFRPKDKINAIANRTTSTVKPPEDNYFAEIQQVISLSEPPQNTTNKNIIQFRVIRDRQGRKLEVKSANLLVRVKYPRKPKIVGKKRKRNKKKKISLYLSTIKENDKPDQLITSIENAKIRKTTWFKLKLPEYLIQNVLDSNQQLLRLYIKCKGCKKGAKLVLVQRSRRPRILKNLRFLRFKGEPKNKKRKSKRTKRTLSRARPFLILHTKVETLLRQKRHVKARTSGCFKQEVTFTFAELGLDDLILSPVSFVTGMCLGECSKNDKSYSDIYENKFLMFKNSTKFVTKTCSPAKLGPLSLLYQNDVNTVRKISLENMLTERCECKIKK